MPCSLIFLIALLASPEECQTFQKAKEDYLAQQKRPIDPEALYLSAIICNSPTEWVIWVNGEKWTSAQPPTNFRIHHVTHKSVTLGIKELRVTLQTNQSYSPKYKGVFEGDIRGEKTPVSNG